MAYLAACLRQSVCPNVRLQTGGGGEGEGSARWRALSHLPADAVTHAPVRVPVGVAAADAVPLAVRVGVRVLLAGSDGVLERVPVSDGVSVPVLLAEAESVAVAL